MSRDATTAAVLGVIGLVVVGALAMGLAGGRETTTVSSIHPPDPAAGPAVSGLRVETGITLPGFQLRPSEYYVIVQLTVGPDCLELLESGASWPHDDEDCRSNVPVEGVVGGSGRTASGETIVFVERKISRECHAALEPLGATPWPIDDEACRT